VNDTPKSDLRLIRRLFTEARPYWVHLAGILALDVMAAPIALLSPVPLKIIVDSVLSTQPLPQFLSDVLPDSWIEPSSLVFLAVGLLFVTAVLTQAQSVGASFLRAYAGGKMVLQFRNQLFRHAQRLSFTYHDMKGNTDALYRVQYDTMAIEHVVNSLIPMIAATVTIVSMIYVTARINSQLALVALFVTPIIVVLTRVYRKPLRTRWRKQKKLEHAAMSVVNEAFSALRVVKAYSQEAREERRYVDRATESLYAKLKATLLQSSFAIGSTLATAVGTAAVLLMGVRAIQAGAMTIGDLLIVMTYLGLLYSPLRTLGERVASLQSALASAERAFSLMDEQPDVPEKADALPLARARGDIEFRNVSFEYAPSDRILKNISVQIPAGARVGIIGKTGAGKSTLLSLLMRFYDAGDGQILLDGRDIRDYRLADLRNQFALVLQDTILFSTTIRENIAYARPDATDAEIEVAAEAAQAHEFISRLPDGYQTVVGERGMRLSGGERQRVALARAFLRDAPVLLLDEPTSAVDTKTESDIMAVMERLMVDRTTIMIAHRLSTLGTCDVVFRMEGGFLRDTNEIDIGAQSAESMPSAIA
jgi:ATP-binding cassette subfamily B protein